MNWETQPLWERLSGAADAGVRGVYSSRQKRIPAFIYFLAAAAGMTALVANNNFKRLIVYWKEYRYLERQKEELIRENRRFKEKIDELRSDPESYEELARRELGMIKPGEERYSLK
ncbi:MAG TPA: septum formation initiator family protein [bacterium]|nr:septum formation initiator family protein [bacterium]